MFASKHQPLHNHPPCRKTQPLCPLLRYVSVERAVLHCCPAAVAEFVHSPRQCKTLLHHPHDTAGLRVAATEGETSPRETVAQHSLDRASSSTRPDPVAVAVAVEEVGATKPPSSVPERTPVCSDSAERGVRLRVSKRPFQQRTGPGRNGKSLPRIRSLRHPQCDACRERGRWKLEATMTVRVQAPPNSMKLMRRLLGEPWRL